MSVVVFHSFEGDHVPSAYALLPEAAKTIIDKSNAGVAIFFVISGFVIAHSLTAAEPTLGMVGRFMLRRSLRLDPSYWVAIALSCLAIAAKGSSDFSSVQIAAHFFYLQDLLGFKPLSPIFWTLCQEVQFYLVFALMLLSRSRTIFALAFAISIPLSCLSIWPGLFTDLWYGFLLGVGVCTYRTSAFFYALCLGALSVIRQDIFMAVCVVTALLILYASASHEMYSWLRWRPIQFLGTISYSLYLFHNPVTGVTFRVASRWLGAGVMPELLTFVASIVLSIGVAWTAYILIERPSMALSRRVSLSVRSDRGSLANATAPVT